MAIKEREKQFVVMGSVLLALMGFYVLAFGPLMDDYIKVTQDLPAKEEELFLVESRAGQLEVKKKEKERLAAEVEAGKLRMIGAEGPGQAAGALFEILKRYADQAGMSVQRQDALKGEDKQPYPEVLVRFDVEGNTGAFRDFLYKIHTSPKLLGVKKMRMSASQDKKNLVVSMEIAALLCEPGFQDLSLIPLDEASLSATQVPTQTAEAVPTATPTPREGPAPAPKPALATGTAAKPAPVFAPFLKPRPTAVGGGTPAPIPFPRKIVPQGTPVPPPSGPPLPLPPGTALEPGMSWDSPEFLPLLPDGQKRAMEKRRTNGAP